MSEINEYVTAINLAMGSCVALQFISLSSSYIYYANTILRDIGVPSIAAIAISLFNLVAPPLAHSYCNSISMHVSIATAFSIDISIALYR